MEGRGAPTSPDEEPPRDPGLRDMHHTYTNEDLEAHKAHNIYMVHAPANNERRRSRHRKHHHHHRSKSTDEETRPMTPPSQRVQFILGEDADGDDSHDMHPLFSEMETLVEMPGGEMEWKETARWVKFEEDVEEGGERWSKPHVATLSLHSLFELRSFLLNGAVILDMDAKNLEEISDLALDNMVNQGCLPYDCKEQFKDALLRKHKHLYEKNKKKHHGGENGNNSRLPLIRSLAEIGRNHSSSKSVGSGFFKALSFSGNNASVTTNPEGGIEQSLSAGSITRNESGEHLDKPGKGNKQFMRKLPPGSEASNIMVGEVPFLEKPASAFIRLSNAANMGNITEVPVPTRFIYIILGPVGGLSRYHEIGRSMATLMSDEVFHEVAYKAKNRSHILAGVDEFLDAVTVLPPGEWDPAIRIEPPSHVPSQQKRKKNPDDEKHEEVDEEAEEARLRAEAGLTRTGRLFGGLINDLKRKKPWYWSDFKDAISVQTIASFFFLYFACLTPIITFGGLLGEATDNNIASMESLVAGLLCGVVYGFFSGQPLTILGSTGPVLVFETILYRFCKDTMEWDYLSFRLWIGLWCSLILIILVAIDASALVCYITRFTEENFATLISAIFIMKALEKVAKIGTKYPMMTHVDDTLIAFNETGGCEEINGTWVGDHPDCKHYYSDVYLLSIILFVMTFLLSTSLKNFKTASFFPTKVRAFISDFAVIIAIFITCGIDFAIGIHTPKLEVPAKFAPTNSPHRGWLIPLFNGNPWWTCIVAVVPAILACILIFMDQQITAVIVNRKEHKLKKGGGYHLDLLCVAVLIGVNSVFGLPWFVAATVLSINHVNSLKLESECAAPGETPRFLGIREQRVTHILIFLCVGLSVLVTQVLRLIPMAVLFGVFLYMGIAGLKGMQFFDRILLMFMPAKYQPDFAYLRLVPLKRVHLFTFIQLLCLAGLWVIKSFQQTSILFPLMLVIMIVVRKLLDKVFTQRELQALDDILPEISRRKRIEKKEEAENKDNQSDEVDTGIVNVPLANGNVMKIPVVPQNPINISEEMNKSGLWMDINTADKKDTKGSNEKKDHESSRDNCRKCRRRKRSKQEQNGDIMKGVVNGHAVDVEMNGSSVCPGHNDTEKNIPEILMENENENESSRL